MGPCADCACAGGFLRRWNCRFDSCCPETTCDNRFCVSFSARRGDATVAQTKYVVGVIRGVGKDDIAAVVFGGVVDGGFGGVAEIFDEGGDDRVVVHDQDDVGGFGGAGEVGDDFGGFGGDAAEGGCGGRAGGGGGFRAVAG